MTAGGLLKIARMEEPKGIRRGLAGLVPTQFKLRDAADASADLVLGV